MFHFCTRLLFIIGFLLGILLACLLAILNNKSNNQSLKIREFPKTPNNSIYDTWFYRKKLTKTKINTDSLRYGNGKYLLESQYLYNTVKVLCIILVRNEKNAKAAKSTWAKSCNEAKFVSLNMEKRKIIPIKKTKETSTWAFLCKALRNMQNHFDWVLIVNDTTFAIVENLRLLVAALDYTKGYYLGHAVTFWTTNYNTGQAGYVLSKGSLMALKNTLNSTDACTASSTYLNQEDFYIGKTLATLNIFPEDTRDSLGLTTFHSFNWQQEFFLGVNYYKMSVYPAVCCSSQSITFQTIEADKMYMYYYLIYHLQIFTNGYLGNVPASTPIPQEEVWKSFLKEHGIHTNYISSEDYYKLWENVVHDPTVFAQQMRDHKNDYE